MSEEYENVDKDELREQFMEAFKGADYPVNNPLDLLPALPDGPSTEFSSGDFKITAMELNQRSSEEGKQDYPYESVEELVDDIMEGLEEYLN